MVRIPIQYTFSNGTMSLTGSASVADYQAALQLITFSNPNDPTGGGTANTRTIGWTVNDGTVSSVPGTATLTLASTAHIWRVTTDVPQQKIAGAHVYSAL